MFSVIPISRICHSEPQVKDVKALRERLRPFATLRMAVLVLMAFVTTAHANPTPPRKTEALSELKGRIASEETRAADMKKKMAGAEDELETARKDLIELGKDLQGSEETLSTLETRIKDLQTEQQDLTAKLKSDYGSMADLILALERIRRMPTETLIIRPGAPLETAQSAILLRSILPVINTRTQQLNADIERLATIQEALAADKAKALSEAEKLKLRKKDMQTLIVKREKLYKQTRSSYEEQAESIARMAAEAKSLEQLVARIEVEPSEPRHERPKKFAFKGSLPGGAWRTPVSGTVLVHYGEKDEIGAVSEGMKISARPGALVTAPVAGVVRFAGPFRNYGNMVIIEHAKGFHSLISGLSRIDTDVGRNISAGEPIGTMPGSGGERTPTLYYELRHNGKPVDPSAKFPDLS